MTSIFKLIVLSILAICMADTEAAEKVQSDTEIDRSGAELSSATMNAAETDPPVFRFSGFGTLGVSHSSQSLGDYVVDGTVPTGAGRSSNWAAGNDSRIGAQLSANFTPRTSAMLQVISEYQADGTYRPAVEWANVKYALSPNAYVRAGRINLPTFLYSDSQEYGYSYPWIHPPSDLYRQQEITSSDGVDAMYRFGIGEEENSIKVIYGKNTLDRPTSTEFSRNLWGIFDTLEYGPATLRAGYQQRESSSQNLLTGVTKAWHQDSDLSAAARYDPGNWFVISEWIQHKATTKIDAMYISAGCRVVKFTPFLTYSQNSQASFQSVFPAPTASSIQNANRSQDTVSLGVRWDFKKNTDFKLQYDLVKLGDNSNGYLANVPAGVTLYGTRFHVVSAVLDFVF